MRPYGYDGYGTKTEIKNLNSLSNVQKAVDEEIQRQSKIYLEGGTVIQETRRFDEASKTTISMRKKEGNVDYKFFPEPNIFPIQLDEAWIKSIQENLNEVPEQRKERYMNQYGLSDYDAVTLTATKELSDFYDEVIKHTNEYKLASNWVTTEMVAYLNKEGISFEENKLQPEHLAVMIDMIIKGEISGKQAKVVFEEMMQGKDPKAVAEAKGMKQMSDPSAILALITAAIEANPQSVTDFKNGKDKAVGFLVGQVMKASKGTANPAMTNKMVQEELKKR